MIDSEMILDGCVGGFAGFHFSHYFLYDHNPILGLVYLGVLVVYLLTEWFYYTRTL